ncbi:MAG: hypothetical protein ACXQS8_07945 [Candidatus Helarchaeales archaeon]
MSEEEKPPSPEELKKMLEAAAAYAEKKREEQRKKFEEHVKSGQTIDIKAEAERLQAKLDEDLRKRKERAAKAAQAGGGIPPRAI